MKFFLPRYWQDLAKTVPAGEGDPVAVIENAVWYNGHYVDMIQPVQSARPVISGGLPLFSGEASMGSAPADDCDTPHVVTG